MTKTMLAQLILSMAVISPAVAGSHPARAPAAKAARTPLVPLAPFTIVDKDGKAIFVMDGGGHLTVMGTTLGTIDARGMVRGATGATVAQFKAGGKLMAGKSLVATIDQDGTLHIGGNASRWTSDGELRAAADAPFMKLVPANTAGRVAASIALALYFSIQPSQ